MNDFRFRIREFNGSLAFAINILVLLELSTSNLKVHHEFTLNYVNLEIRFVRQRIGKTRHTWFLFNTVCIWE